MPRRTLVPALFFDFDNTLTSGDVLDRVIETFSPDEAWRDWEDAWEHGRLSARECLRRQVENLRVDRLALFDYLLQVRVDPAFPAIVDWARARRIEVSIVSDSFVPLIDHILANNGVEGVRVYANDLVFSGDRLLPAFPYADPACMRSANAKARHMQPYRRSRYLVFAGDGHSDLDAALASDLIFAKSTLAMELTALHVDFCPFETLDPVFARMRVEFSGARAAYLRLA
ncbi:MAG TPA: MtnX-like HAD-IB family phosphatase [Burkholderiales bacterium]|nr:MtnX-like HAD-IB family phosphatase [Burkholderiales bacterium]